MANFSCSYFFIPQLDRTALMRAADAGHIEVVKYLVNTGIADINARDKTGMSALSYAASNNNTEIVNFLLFDANALGDETDGVSNGRIPVMPSLTDYYIINRVE